MFFMLNITKEFLNRCPKWKEAGWKVGDVVDMATLDQTTQNRVASHPPKRPGG